MLQDGVLYAKKTITIILIGFIIGITCTIGVGSYIFDKSGWRETIKHSKEVEKQLHLYGAVKPLPKVRPNTSSPLYPPKEKKCFWCGSKR